MSFVAENFERCKTWLEAALEHSSGCWGIDDVKAAIEKDPVNTILWATPNSATVSVFEDTPKCKVIKFWLAGGALDELLLTEKHAVEFAKQQGCRLSVVVGRDGWLRRLKGYRKVATIMVKDI